MDELLSVAKELLEDFDLYGNPIQLRIIAKLRRAVKAAQQGVQLTGLTCPVHGLKLIDGYCPSLTCLYSPPRN